MPCDPSCGWPTAFALKELTAAEEAKICALVKNALSEPWGRAFPAAPGVSLARHSCAWPARRRGWVAGFAAGRDARRRLERTSPTSIPGTGAPCAPALE